jgi:DNA-binding MarR family transcriptional regulator
MPARRSAASKADAIPLERFIKIAEFRASLLTFLRHSEHACRRWGLTPQRYLLLLTIKGAPDRSERLSLTEIAERLELSPNAVSELCARAEEAGLLARERSSDDGRIVFLRVTPDGERRLTGVILDSDEDRAELLQKFEELSDAFVVSARPHRARRR